MKNFDEQVNLQARLAKQGIFSSFLVPSPYADIIEELLNKLEVKDNGDQSSANVPANEGQRENPSNDAAETTGEPTTGSTPTASTAKSDS